MNIFRRIVASFLTTLVLIILLLSSLAFSLDQNLASPKKLETWLANSNIYGTVIKQVLQNAQNSAAKDAQNNSGNSGGISLTNEAVYQAAQSAFTANLLEDSVNQILDNNYSWLQGKITQPNFVIDLHGAKQSFADQVSKYAQTRYASLPQCSTAQLSQLATADPLQVTCQSSTLSPAVEGTQVNQQIYQSKDFLGNPQIGADSLTVKNLPYYKTFSGAPSIYSWATKAWWVLLLLAAALSGLIMLVHPSRRKGLKLVLRTTWFAGFILVAGKLVYTLLYKSTLTKIFNHTKDNFIRDPSLNLATSITKGISSYMFYFGIALLVLSSAALIALWLPKRRENSKAAARRPDVKNLPTKQTESAEQAKEFLSDELPETNYLEEEPETKSSKLAEKIKVAPQKPSTPARPAQPKKRNLVQ